MYRKIRELRESNDLYQKQLASFLHIAQTTYSNYELGSRQIPIPTLIKLANFYGTSVDYLLDLTDEVKPHRQNKLN